jgi:Dictyostelium (slime mold) repeat/Bacterial pre-peptidase C-terminal domain
MRFLACVLLLASCGGDGSGGGGDDGGGHPIPDGFFQDKCMNASDCDDGDPCTVDACSASQGCLHTVMNCSGVGDACNAGSCNSTTGSCFATPANEGLPCMTGTTPGTCKMGSCIALPLCSMSTTTLACGSTVSDATLGASLISDYSTCATGESGAERSFKFVTYQNRQVTMTLSNQLVDLDLMVLDGDKCVATAACEGASLNQGTAEDAVTFQATAYQYYTVVVDGKNGFSGSFTLNADCSTCKPITTLACNMTYSGDSTGTHATTALSSYACTSEPGPEDTYKLTPTATTLYKMKLSGLTQDLDLVVVDDYSDCNPNYCDAYATTAGTGDENLSFKGYSGVQYAVVVDSKSTGGPYTLEVDCPPSCYGNLYMGCSYSPDSRRNDDATSSKDVVDNWACDLNTTGPEVVYQFYASTTAAYTFTLTGLTDDLDLIVVKGDYSTCDPTTACITSSTNAGTAGESVTFNATAGNYYYIAVDGKNGATSPYTLKLKSTVCPGPSCWTSSPLGCAFLQDSRRNDDVNRSTIRVDDWACDANTTGPEVMYRFQPPVAGSYTVSLDGLSANLDLVVVSNTSSAICQSSAACVASSTNTGTADESVTFAADTSHTYYIAVDGAQGAVSPYHVSIASASCGAPVCVVGTSLSCSVGSATSRNDAVGATNDVDSWACDANTTGPEYVWVFTPPAPGTYTIEMIGLHADLDLIVQEVPVGGACSPTAACFASSTNAGTLDESVTFTTTSGKSYLIIVDGKNGATSRYTLAITDGCP